MIDFKDFLDENYNFERVKFSELNEKTLNPMTYDRFFKYAQPVIDDIKKENPIKSIYDDYAVLPKEDAEKLEDFLNRRYEDDVISELKNFKFSNGWRWTQIFKGNFSGYTDGLKSKNRGNAVEEKCVEDIEQYLKFGINNCKSYVQDLVNLIKDKFPDYDIVGVSHDGGKNQKREVDVNSNGCPVVKKGTGETLSDITLVMQNSKDASKYEYLSIKFGKTVAFLNGGIRKIFKTEEMKQHAINPENPLNKKAEGFLKSFGLDTQKFCLAFTEYNPEAALAIKGNRKRDLTSDIVTTSYKLEGDFKDFLINAIGYNYILVHSHDEQRNKVIIKDMSQDYVRSLVNGTVNATIYYPLKGNKKKVVIALTLSDTLYLEIDLRNTSGGIFPDKLVALYKFLRY